MSAMILIVHDDENLSRRIRSVVRGEGYQAITVSSGLAALELLETCPIDLVITDPSSSCALGRDPSVALRSLSPSTSVLALADDETADATGPRRSRQSFESRLVSRVERILSRRGERAGNGHGLGQADPARVGNGNGHGASEPEQHTRAGNGNGASATKPARRRTSGNGRGHGIAGCGDTGTLCGIVGVSKPMVEAMELIRRVARERSSVLVLGETGTGKELVARAIHQLSPRNEHAIVPVNLAAVPVDLIESELFGHTRSAFTGAAADRAGKFEVADGGTLFLDEILDAPLALQPKLLRVLQDGVVERLGSNKPRRVDVRIIASANFDLGAEVEAGRFRADLYYRLRVVELRLPPLRERPEDIAPLVKHFLRMYGRSRWGHAAQITERALRTLEEYAWPGNVRQLQHVIEQAVVLGQSGTLDVDMLRLDAQVSPAQDRFEAMYLPDAVAQLEQEMITRALSTTGNVKARAARLLGISERSLWYKLGKYGLL